jgi:nicotinamide-nucleotide adenylyltransferase
MIRALYVGRFQPFHLGHLLVIKHILSQADNIIIGIGSSEDNYQLDNPFTAGERFEMIERSLLKEGISKDKYYIIPMRNINNYALWVAHISLLLPKYDIVYTGSPVIKSLFTQHGKYKVVDIKKELLISGTAIRKKIIKEDNSWEKDVPEEVVRKIKEISGEYRIRHVGTG